MIYMQVLKYRLVLMQVFKLMTEEPVKSHTILILLFLSQLYAKLFRTFGESCLECPYIPKSNFALGEETGFSSSNTKGPGHLAGAGAFFINTL